MISDIKIINNSKPSYLYKYAVCTIVNNWNEYKEMRASFENAGFCEDTEYLVADNSKENRYDAYRSISEFFRQAQAAFLIIAHQDVRLIDNRKKLETCLSELDQLDNGWAICGNAGAKGYHQHVTYITYHSHEERYAPLPCRVKSLDENLLIIRRDSGLTISTDLKGFHFYGTDLCIMAHIIGSSAWVIPFMVLHLSKGNLKELEAGKRDFVIRYGNKLNIGYMQTTCTQFYLSNSMKKNKWLNSVILFFLIKQIKRYPYLLSKWLKKV